MVEIQVEINTTQDLSSLEVEVVDSGQGEAKTTVPLDVASLLERRREVEDAVLADPDPANTEVVREIGKTLFTALLGSGEVGGRYQANVAVAAERQERLRVVVRIDDPELARLPWETMYDPAAAQYVCLRHQLVRHVKAALAPQLRVQLPLRILGIVSAPSDQDELDVAKEQRLLAQALSAPCRDRKIELHWAGASTWQALHETLMAGPWHALHYIGHGDFDVDRNQGVLLLTHDDGTTNPVDADQLAVLLGRSQSMPSLVVLNSCSGATTGATDLFTGTASALVRGGVSAVAAMQYSISDDAASAFAQGFYTAIAHGRGVDEAASDGRVAIRGTLADTLEWVTPVMYLRGEQTHLFDLASSPQNGVPEKHRRRRWFGLGRRPKPAMRRAAPDTVEPIQLISPGGPINAISWDPDEGRRIAIATPTNTLAFADINGRQPKEPVTIRDYGRFLASVRIVDVAFTSRGDGLITASNYDPYELLTGPSEGIRGAVQIWWSDTGKQVREVGFDTVACAVRFAPGNERVAIAEGNEALIFAWAADARKPALQLPHGGKVNTLAYSPDGTKIATGSADHTAKIWDARNGQALLPIPHDGPVTAVAFNADGTRLATAGPDNTARIWNAANRTCALELAHDDVVRAVHFSPNGLWVVTGGADNTAWIWDATDGRRLRRLPHETAVTVAVFSPDSMLVATVGLDETARIWSLTGL